MDLDYWKGRWDNNTYTWHSSGPQKHLTEHFQKLIGPPEKRYGAIHELARVKESLIRIFRPPASRFFIPLCGKAGDLMWLRNENENNVVIGVEGIERVVEEVFKENGIEYEKSEIPGGAGKRFTVRIRLKE